MFNDRLDKPGWPVQRKFGCKHNYSLDGGIWVCWVERRPPSGNPRVFVSPLGARPARSPHLTLRPTGPSGS
eukprot:4505019-Lingulodinium_polyedra.AAC.1